MSLEQKLKQRKILRRLHSSEVAEAVKSGKKFILVENDFDNIPFGYSLIDMRHNGKSFRTLVPQSLLFYMANPGEGNVDDALDEITDFYDDIRDFEDNLLEDNDKSVQGTNWAVMARNAYETYLINKLTKSGDNPDKAEFDEEILKDLGLDDKYVSERVKAMAAVALDKNPNEIRKYGVDSVLKHVTVRERVEKELTREEFDNITCWAGSHYEIKEEYRNNPDIDYNIEYRHNKNYKVGKKTIHQRHEKFLDATVGKLEKEIENHKLQKHSSVGRHDLNLLRMYANLAYIAKENPNAQLSIQPLEEE